MFIENGFQISEIIARYEAIKFHKAQQFDL